MMHRKPMKNIPVNIIREILFQAGVMTLNGQSGIIQVFKVFLDDPNYEFTSYEIYNSVPKSQSRSNIRCNLLKLRKVHLIQKHGTKYKLSSRNVFFNLYLEAEYRLMKDRLNKLFDKVGF